MHFWRWPIVAGALVVLAAAAPAQAQPAPGQPQSFSPDSGSAFLRFFEHGEWYFSIGTNEDYWAPTDITVSQPSLGNNFTIYSVLDGNDHPAGGDEAPQYNIRVVIFYRKLRYRIQPRSYEVFHQRGPDGPVDWHDRRYAGQCIHPAHQYVLFGRAAQRRQSCDGRRGLPVPADRQDQRNAQCCRDRQGRRRRDATGHLRIRSWATIRSMSWHQIVRQPDRLSQRLAEPQRLDHRRRTGFLRVVLFKPVYLELTDKVADPDFGGFAGLPGTLQASVDERG